MQKAEKEKYKKIAECLREYYVPFARVIALIVFLLLTSELFNMAAPYLFGKIIDAVFAHRDGAYVFALIAALFIFGMISSSLGKVREWVEVHKFNLDVWQHISEHSLRKLFGLSLGQ